MFITMDYGGVPEQDIAEIVGDDFHFIEDQFQAIKSTGIGLYWVEGEDYGIAEDDTNKGDGSQFEFLYTVRYKQAR